MPSFDTPEPISVTLEFYIGSARITASKRTDTVVEVLPANGADDADVRAAQQTRVTYAGGALLVKGPKKSSLFGKSGAIDVTIELPSGSDVQGTSPMADFSCEGRLGDCRFKTSLGDIQLDEAGAVYLKTSHGDVRLERATGDVEIIGAGRIDVGAIAGAATVKNGNGETSIGEVTGELRANSSNGRIAVGIAHAGVDAKSANGAIRVGEVARGKVVLQGAAGDLEIGIREATAAWLEVNTKIGSVRNSLGPAEGPEASEETVEVRATTGIGDIVIRRS
jgi:putative adhesin